MITVVAAASCYPEYREILARQVAAVPGAVLHVVENASTASVNAVLRSVTTPLVVLVDAYSLPLGDWLRKSVPSRVPLVGGICRTYAGTRAGYGFIRQHAGVRTIVRQAVALAAVGSQPVYIDLPSDGCVLVRGAHLTKLDYLDETLPLSLAISEFALRTREAGYEIAFDADLRIERAAANIELSLDDELQFCKLRSEAEWNTLLSGHARRTELHAVTLLGHGSNDEKRLREWLQAAGYPVHDAFVCPADAVAEVLDERLARREQLLACVDLRTKPMQNWLLHCVEAISGAPTIGLATHDSNGRNSRLETVDATATLVVTPRLPVQITRNLDAATLDDALAELGRRAADLGIVSIGTPLGIERCNDRRLAPLDRFALESRLRTSGERPKISMVLLAGSASSVHRYTTDALRSYSGDLRELLVVVRSDAPKITARLRNHPNVELFVDVDDELAGVALSRALAAAKGDYVMLVRDDFLVAEHWLDTLYAHLERLPSAGIATPRLSAVPGAQNCEDELFADSVEFRLAAERRRKARAREAQLVDYVQMPVMLMRRAVLDTIGGFDETLGTSNLGIADYCLRARNAGFQIALAEDVFLHHIPFEHTELPFESLMSDASYARSFATKWRIDGQVLDTANLGGLVHAPVAARHRYVALATDVPAPPRPQTEAHETRTVLLLPLAEEAAWQQAGNVVRKYLNTFTSDDRVTLAIGRQDDIRTSVLARRIRKMITEGSLDEARVPDIVISDADARETWLSSLPNGPRYLLLADAQLPTITVCADLSPSGLRRIVSSLSESETTKEATL